MLKITIPNNFPSERQYIIEVIFREFLGLDYTIESGGGDAWSIELPGGIINIRDSFFSRFNDTETYLDAENIPSKVEFVSGSFLPEENIPVIYGSSEVKVNGSTIQCGIDIFASVFFMLTRWEEHVVNEKDAHSRFPGESSLAYKFNFLKRPVVNEYVEFLWNMMLKLGIDESLRKSGQYELIPTHDVDKVYYNYQFEKIIGDILVDFKPQNALKRIYYDLKKENKYDTFDWLMDISEKQGLVSRFYFLSDGKANEDKGFLLHDKFILDLKDKIKSRGHMVGLHSGYNTYNDSEEWLRQKELLEERFGLDVNEGRQHYLRLTVPETLQLWNDNGMVIDSSMGYSSQAGFRCGTADEFTFFNVLTGKKMALKERPLIFMDETFRIRNRPAESIDNARKAMDHFKDVCRRYSMPLTILFHNSSFEPLRWKGWKEFYENEVMI